MKICKLFSVFLALAMLLSCAGCSSSASKEGTAEQAAGFQDVSELVLQADALYEQGDYTNSLEQYLLAMQQNPKDVNARLGAVRCQIALGNYAVAAMNLSTLNELAPGSHEVCELYLEIAAKDGRNGSEYAMTAFRMAHQFGFDDILAGLPASPEILPLSELKDGTALVEIRNNEPGSKIEIFVTNRDNQNASRMLSHPGTVRLLRGSNIVSAHVVKDGLTSEWVSEEYTIDYPEQVLEFSDPLMEQLARITLNKDTGALTNYDCDKVYSLYWNNLMQRYDYSDYAKLKLTTLEDLKHFPGLQYLALENQKLLEDYSPLQYCSNLEKLVLDNCMLKSLSLMEYVPQLQSLELYANPLSDLSALENGSSLVSLSITENKVAYSIEKVLRAHPGLTSLGMDDTALADFSVMGTLKELETLEIVGITNIDYNALSSLHKLRSLNIEFSLVREGYYRRNLQIPSLFFLQGMDKLEYLYLHGVNNVEDANYIKALSNLQYLYLYQSGITKKSDAMNLLQQALPNCIIRY